MISLGVLFIVMPTIPKSIQTLFNDHQARIAAVSYNGSDFHDIAQVQVHWKRFRFGYPFDSRPYIEIGTANDRQETASLCTRALAREAHRVGR
jgi:hypothetical protein